MISLEPAVAQEIVERTMKVIPCNVNVMDARGVILGSGDPDRVGEIHAGAQLALSRARTIEIKVADTRVLQGARAGINIPVSVRGTLCGVVGVTGRPAEVRPFGEMVRVMAEMILEQALLVRELQHEKRYREEFVDQLIRQSAASRAELEVWAVRLGVDFQRPRSAIVLQLTDPALSQHAAISELERCQAQLFGRDPSLLMSITSPRELVILKTGAPTRNDRTTAAEARQQLLMIDETCTRAVDTPTELALGVALPGIDGVPLSYRCACQTLRVGRARDAGARLFSYYELGFPVILSGLDGGWQAEQLRRPLSRLQQRDTRGATLRQTLVAWFRHDCQADRTARALGVHRNTLDYRLRQIGEITGLELDRIDDRLLIYTALQLE